MIVKPPPGTSENLLGARGRRPKSESLDRNIEDAATSNGRRWWPFAVLLLILATAATVTVYGLSPRLNTPPSDLVFYNVRRGDLPITVTERGNLESQQNLEIICEVDDVPGDNINGTTILWIIPNGSSVKEGDLLVELDAAPHNERFDQQILETERARSVQIQAQAKYDNQLTQNERNKANAELEVTLSQLEVEMFTDDENGTYKLEVEEIKRLIDDVNNEIRAAQANLKLKENEKRGIESLFKLGYAGKSELDRIRLDFLQAEGQFAAKVNKLETQLASLSKKEVYEQKMASLKLQGKLETAHRELDQVQRNNEALLAQSRAALDAANESLKKEEERLARYREQLGKCKIYAPQEGMVAYAVSQSRYYREDIREGAAARPRQTLLSLPNLSSMQVKTAVHESVLDQIRQGLPATIRMDAFSDRLYRGSVRSVAVLPDPGGYLSSDTKVYETVVTVDEEVAQLKPGMTAVVEIHVDRLLGVLTIPVQAVVQIQKQTWCYVGVQGKPERRSLKLGRTNDKFVEVVEGLSEGEQIVLNPMALVQESDEEEPAADEQAEAGAEPAESGAERGESGAEPAESGAERGESGAERGESGAEPGERAEPAARTEPTPSRPPGRKAKPSNPD